MMKLPVKTVTKPSNIWGITAANINACHLEAVFFAGVGYGSLNPLAARAWRALCVAVLAAFPGVILTITSTADALRTYAQQVTAFRGRYSATYDPAIHTKDHQRVWNGVRYYLRRGAIPCAVPGTGWHPYGLAVDAALYDPNLNDSDPYPGDPRWIRSDPALWAWLQANAVSLGWSWANATEGVDDPHLQYFAGDAVPQRVLEIEQWLAAHAASV